MIKYIIIIVCVLGMCACTQNENSHNQAESEEQKSVDKDVYGVQTDIHTPDYVRHNVSIIVVDSCEYVCYGDAIIHKANCRNPIHKHHD